MTTTSVDKKLEVDAPIGMVYNQWTQFEEFPVFMEGVQEVQQLEDERLHWVAEVGGEHREWYARITRQVPDDVIAWESEGGAGVDGTVIFHPTDKGGTEVELHMQYEPEGFKEQVGGALGFLSRKVDGDLKRFKTYVEQRGVESGAWRGEIIHGADNDAKSQINVTNTIPPRHSGPPDQTVVNRGSGLPGTSGGSELRDDFGASRRETGLPGAELNQRFQTGREELNDPINTNADPDYPVVAPENSTPKQGPEAMPGKAGEDARRRAENAPLFGAAKPAHEPDADVSAHRKLDAETDQH
jgi:hypothetical protein